jgi:hypothetical protein
VDEFLPSELAPSRLGRLILRQPLNLKRMDIFLNSEILPQQLSPSRVELRQVLYLNSFIALPGFSEATGKAPRYFT